MAVVSNTCNGTYGSDCRIYLEYTLNSQSIANDTSNITLHLYGQAINSNVGAYNFNNQSIANIKINGATKVSSNTLNMDFRNKKKVDMLNWTGNVAHNADGTLTITISGYFDTNGPSSVTTASVSYKWTLPTIPRTSSVTCADGNIGSATTININRASSSFTHTLSYSFQGLTGNIATKTTNTSIGWTIPTTFLSKIPNSMSGQGTITCQTYSGDTLVGTSTCTFNAFVVNSNPTISGTIVDTNTSAIGATGNNNILIRYISNAQVTISATPKNSATISSVKVVNGSKSSTSSSSTISAVDSGIFDLSCTDSRGLYASTTVTKTLIEYIKPVIISASLSRPSTTSNTINFSINGQVFNGSFGAKNNGFELKWRYKLSTASSYGNYTALTATRSGNNFSCSGTLGTDFDYTESYNFEFVVSDYFTSYTYSTTVTRGLPIIDIGKNDVNVNGNIYMKGQQISCNYKKGVNLRDLDENTYYPVVGSAIPKGGMHHLKLAVQLDSSTNPSWSTHYAGFTAILDILQEACGWGVTDGVGIVLEYSYKFASSNPVSYTQLTDLSLPVFWCRGGGQYYIYTDYESNWDIITSSTSFSNQTVAPTSSLPSLSVPRNTIYSNITGGYVYANGLLKSTNYDNTVTIGSQNSGYCHFINSTNIPFYFNNTIDAAGLIKCTSNGNTLTIGSQNSSYCHFSNSVNRPFYFNNTVCIDGKLEMGYVYVLSRGTDTTYFGTDSNSSGQKTALRGNTVRIYSHTSGAVYLGYSGSTAITSDENLKDIYGIDEKYIEFFKKLKPITYIYKNKGHRNHIGFGARQVEEALIDSGLTTEQFAGILKDEDITISADEMGTEEDVHFDELYSLRYEEFIALNTLMIQKQAKQIEEQNKTIEDLKKRIEILEKKNKESL